MLNPWEITQKIAGSFHFSIHLSLSTGPNEVGKDHFEVCGMFLYLDLNNLKPLPMFSFPLAKFLANKGVNFYMALLVVAILAGCKKDEPADPSFYASVKIGGQTWMVKNLDVVKYRNGDPIPMLSDTAAWKSTTTGACCNYNNDTSLVNTYGRIYNWYAVNDSRKLAPEGWHIASFSEWQTLINHLGGIDVAGGKLKEMGFEHWVQPNTAATDEVGFTALPGGFRSETDGAYSSMGGFGAWWTSSPSSATHAWGIALTSITGKAYSNENTSHFGAYVRCIKD